MQLGLGRALFARGRQLLAWRFIALTRRFVILGCEHVSGLLPPLRRFAPADVRDDGQKIDLVTLARNSLNHTAERILVELVRRKTETA